MAQYGWWVVAGVVVVWQAQIYGSSIVSRIRSKYFERPIVIGIYLSCLF